ncbi:MAG: hypothetical protein H8D78_10800 [Chloroflexi bacterium]|nr:hypothetical protein [Chloroflexota bacterium]
MTITADQQSRTEAQAIDVELRLYTAPRYDVDEAAIVADETYSVGAEWMEITAKVTKPVQFSNTWDVSRAIIDWTAKVGGVLYDSVLLAPERMLLCMRRLWCLATGWTDWTVWFAGYIQALPSIADDHRQGGEWQVEVRSLSCFLEADDAPAHVFGRRNLAQEGTASASSTLAAIAGEMGKGEFAGTPVVDAAQANDGNLDTLWISNLAPTVTAETPYVATGSDYAINEIYRETTAEDANSRWIEIFCRHVGELGPGHVAGDGFRYLSLWSESTGKGLCFAPDKSNVQEIVAPGNHAVLCYDRRYFDGKWNAGDAVVLEWRHLVCCDYSSGEDWTYDPEGDVLYFYPLATNQGADPGEVVAWGDVADPDVWPNWSGVAAAQPQPGQSLRRDPAGMITGNVSNAGNFTLEDYPSPGKHYTGTDADWEWWSVDLGTLTWTLGADLNVVDTTATISPDTDGLTGSGDILIGADVIAYTGKTSTTLTGVSGVAELHASGSALYQYENEAATSLWKVGGIGWERREVLDGTTRVVPQVFGAWTSTEASPVRPPTANWRDDWTGRKGVNDYNSFAWQFQLTTPVRARHVMLIIKKMRDDGRAKLNEVSVYPDEWTVENEDDTWLDGVDAQAIIEHLLITHYGLAAGQVSVVANAFMGDVSTQKASYLDVISELCRRTGTVMRFTRVPRVVVVKDLTWGMHGALATWYTITRSAAFNVRMERRRKDRISQVQLVARNPQEGRTYVVSYPESAGEGGVRLIYDELIVGSENEARQAAERMYKQLQATRRLEVSMSGISDEWCRPGARRVAVTWDVDASDGDELDAALFLVESIEVTVKMGQPKGYSETVRLREYVP